MHIVSNIFKIISFRVKSTRLCNPAVGLNVGGRGNFNKSFKQCIQKKNLFEQVLLNRKPQKKQKFSC